MRGSARSSYGTATSADDHGAECGGRPSPKGLCDGGVIFSVVDMTAVLARGAWVPGLKTDDVKDSKPRNQPPGVAVFTSGTEGYNCFRIPGLAVAARAGSFGPAGTLFAFAGEAQRKHLSCPLNTNVRHVR